MVTLIPGDGIGREMTDAVRAVFTAANVPVDFEQIDLIADDKGEYGFLSISVYRCSSIGH